MLIPGYAKDVLGTDARGFGLLETSIPIGFLCGALMLSAFKPKTVGGLMVISMICFSVFVFGLGLSKLLGLSMGLLILMGLMLAMMNISFGVVFGSLIPNEMQGRVGGLSQALATGFAPLGMALAPILIGVLGGIPTVLQLIGGLSCLAGLGFLTIPGFLQLSTTKPAVPENNLEPV